MAEEMKTINDVPMILRREIEARMVAPFIRAFSEVFGEEETMTIVKSVIAGLAEEAGSGLAEMLGDNSLQCFAEKVTPAFGAGGALQFEVKEATDETVRMDIVRCAYVDMYERLGLKDLGGVLSCGRDEYLIKGFNPDVEFTREYTLMSGGPVCDFCLRTKAEKKD